MHPVDVYLIRSILPLLPFYKSYHRSTVMSGKRQQDDDDFLKEWTIPEEDRGKYTSQPWAGEFRWFRSTNVVCLVQYRRRRQRDTESE